jgi:polysulfide reductase chain C
MNEVTWGIPVVVYLFLAGLGAGSFFLGVIFSRNNGEGWQLCSRRAFLLAPLAIAVGLLMLILDLRYKTRFWRTLTVLNPGSPMSIGVWLLTAFFVVATLNAVCWLPASVRRRIPLVGSFRFWSRPGMRRLLGYGGIPFALGISVYTGVLLSVTIIPLWRNLSLPLLFFISALSLGIEGGAVAGMMSLGKANAEAMKEPLQFLKRCYRVLLPLYLFAALLFISWLTIASASRAEALRFMAGWSGFIWWIGVVGAGILLPLILVAGKSKGPVRHAWLFSGCLLLGDFLLRLVLILAGQGSV